MVTNKAIGVVLTLFKFNHYAVSLVIIGVRPVVDAVDSLRIAFP